MAREIYYNFNADAPPDEPTKSSTLYTVPLVYPVGGGYYCAKAFDGNDSSVVTRKSFEKSPEDYIHYYPLTTDFNDHAGSNNLINSNCTIDSNGCLIDTNSDLLNFTTAISNPVITISMKYIPSGSNTWRNLLGNNAEQCALFCSGNTLGYYNSGFVSSSFDLVNSVEYNLVVIKSGNDCIIYANGEIKLDVNNCFSNSSYPIVNIGGNSYGQSALGIIKEIKIFDRVLTQDEINSF